MKVFFEVGCSKSKSTLDSPCSCGQDASYVGLPIFDPELKSRHFWSHKIFEWLFFLCIYSESENKVLKLFQKVNVNILFSLSE